MRFVVRIREVDPEHAPAMRRQRMTRDLVREARFAGAAESRERQEPRCGQDLATLGELAFTADEAGRERRQIVRRVKEVRGERGIDEREVRGGVVRQRLHRLDLGSVEALEIVVLARDQDADHVTACPQRPGERGIGLRARIGRNHRPVRRAQRAHERVVVSQLCGLALERVRDGHIGFAIFHVQDGAARREERVESRNESSLELGAVDDLGELVAKRGDRVAVLLRVPVEACFDKRATLRSPSANRPATAATTVSATSMGVERDENT